MGDRSKGAVLLARRTESQETIAAAVGGVTRVTVAHWQSGNTKPTQARRRRLRELYGIPETSFDEPVDAAPSTSAAFLSSSAAAPSADEVPEDLIGMATLVQNETRRELRNLREDDSTTYDERLRAYERATGIIERLAKIKGELELGRRLLTLPQWKAVEREIRTFLARHPEIAADFESVMRGLDSQLRGNVIDRKS